MPLGKLVNVNPPTPEFLDYRDAEVTFLPLAAVWPYGRADVSGRAIAAKVAGGYTQFRNGDVLVPKITPTFEAARAIVADLETPLGAGTTELHVLRALPGVDARFIAYVTRSLPFLQEGATTLQGVGNLRRVPSDWLTKFPVLITDLEEQHDIADYLDRETNRIDELIAEQRGLIETLRERRDAGWSSLYERAISVGRMIQVRRVLESIVDGPFGSSLTSAHYSDEGARVVRLGNIGINDFRDEDQAFVSLEYAAKLSSHAARPGDVVIAGLGDERWPLGRAAVLPEMGPAIVKADCYRARPNSLVSAQYLAWALSAPASRRQMALLARGATRARLNTSVVREVTIPVPSLEQQTEIVQAGKVDNSRIDALIAESEELIALSQERRVALITAAVTGQFDVRTAA